MATSRPNKPATPAASGKKPAAPKTEAPSRRDRLASFEAERKKEQRNRNIRVLALCVVLAMALLSYPIYLVVKDNQARNRAAADIGVAASAAGCDEPVEHPATGNQEHVAVGTAITYPETPPDSGKHYDTPAPFAKHFYAVGDRPAVGTLVHNLEHGYTLVWYRSDAPKDQIDQLEAFSKTFTDQLLSAQDFTSKFVAAPWTPEDGAGFPEGKNVVLTHWIAGDPDAQGNLPNQLGVRQPCSSVSGEAIKAFMEKYPYSDSPEPRGA